MKRRSPIHRDLRTPKYRKRIVKSKRVYNRKRKERLPRIDLGGVRCGDPIRLG